MRKPTWKQFLVGYFCLFLGTQISLWGWPIPSRPLLGVSLVNMIFVCINLFGMMISMSTGWAPWRDEYDDKTPKPKHSVAGFFRWLFTASKYES